MSRSMLAVHPTLRALIRDEIAAAAAAQSRDMALNVATAFATAQSTAFTALAQALHRQGAVDAADLADSVQRAARALPPTVPERAQVALMLGAMADAIRVATARR